MKKIILLVWLLTLLSCGKSEYTYTASETLSVNSLGWNKVDILGSGKGMFRHTGGVSGTTGTDSTVWYLDDDGQRVEKKYAAKEGYARRTVNFENKAGQPRIIVYEKSTATTKAKHTVKDIDFAFAELEYATRVHPVSDQKILKTVLEIINSGQSMPDLDGNGDDLVGCPSLVLYNVSSEPAGWITLGNNGYYLLSPLPNNEVGGVAGHTWIFVGEEPHRKLVSLVKGLKETAENH